MKRIKQRNKTMEKGIKVVVALLLAMSTFVSVPQDKVRAAESPLKRGIMLGSQVTTQLDPTTNTNIADDWKGNYLHWGKLTDRKWQILSGEAAEFGDNGMLILSGPIGGNKFDRSRRSAVYEGSVLEKHIDGLYNDGVVLNDLEKEATLVSSNTGGETYFNSRGVEFKEAKFDNKKFFAPTAHVLFNPIYGFYADPTAPGINKSIYTNIRRGYWLSSMETDRERADCAGLVYADRFEEHLVDNSFDTRFVSKVDSKSSIFVSANTGAKPVSGVSNVLTPVSNSDSMDWKMTLKDPNQNIVIAKATRKSATKVEISYTKEAAGAYVGAVIVDADNNIVSYGHIARDATTGTASVELPANFEANGYQLKVFTEDCNENTTDYASDLKDVDVTRFIINYELYGGKNNVANPATYASDETVTFATPTKVGYTFDGWYDADQGGSPVVTIPAGSRGDKTIYARWTANTYIVKYDGNGETSGSMTSLPMTYGVEKSLADSAFLRAGYVFDGWNTLADGSGITHTDKEVVKNLTVTNNDTVTLYAKWKVTDYSITYELDGGDNNAANPATYTIDDTVTFAAPTKVGYTFDGWYDADKGGGPVITISAGSSGDKIIYARWTTDAYKITYVLNGGDNSATNPTTYTIDETVTFAAPTKVGYTFNGWYNGETGGSKVTSIAKGSIGNKIIYARYIINTYNVEFKDYNGTVLKSDTVNYNSAAIAPVNPTREGYTFVRWDKTFDKVTSDMVITAVYTKNTVPVEPVKPQEPTVVPTNPSKPNGGNGNTPSTSQEPVTSGTIENMETIKPKSNVESKAGYEKQLQELYTKYSKGQSKEVKAQLKKILEDSLQELNTTNGKSVVIKADVEMRKCIKDVGLETAGDFVVLNLILLLAAVLGGVLAIIKKKKYRVLASVIAVGGCIYFSTVTWGFDRFTIADSMTIVYVIVLIISMAIVMMKEEN